LELLAERYQPLGELGRGGMGTVLRAHDQLLDRAVAIKTLSANALGEEARARLLAEARAAARLNHPNIVSTYDAGEADGDAYIVMELVEGRSLHDQPPETIEGVLDIARQICQALAHAHAAGIVHRDLKPENVIVTADGASSCSILVARRLPRLTAEAHQWHRVLSGAGAGHGQGGRRPRRPVLSGRDALRVVDETASLHGR
jgi:serine/threonine protein kinase